MGLYEYVTKLYELYSFYTGKCSRYLSVESDIRKDVNDMCNLSQGIKEQAYVEGTENGIAIGKQEGITIGKREGIAETIIKMYRKGYEAEQIGDILDMEVEEVQEIIENE